MKYENVVTGGLLLKWFSALLEDLGSNQNMIYFYGWLDGWLDCWIGGFYILYFSTSKGLIGQPVTMKVQ